MNVLGKSPSPMRVAVIAGAVALLASAVTPVHAAPVRSKTKIAAKTLQPQQVSPAPAPAPAPAPSPARKTGGGSAGRLSLQWMIGAELRP